MFGLMLLALEPELVFCLLSTLGLIVTDKLRVYVIHTLLILAILCKIILTIFIFISLVGRLQIFRLIFSC